jgi:hypothetical protein
MRSMTERIARTLISGALREGWQGVLRVSVGALAAFQILAIDNPVYAQDINVGGNVALTITTGVPNGQPLPVQNASVRLRFRRQTVTTKITVATSCPNQHFVLSVVAAGLTHGIAAPQVALTNGMPETDFVTNIPARAGGSPQAECTLSYTASATFAQGNSVELGPDIHTVRYTLIAQ